MMTSDSKARALATVLVIGAGCSLSREIAAKLAEAGAEVVTALPEERRWAGGYSLDGLQIYNPHIEAVPSQRRVVRQERYSPPRKMQAMLAKNRR